MRSSARTLAVAAAALVVGAAWLRLEHPLAPLWRVLALVALALGAAVPSRWGWRAAATLVAIVAAAWLAVGVWLAPTRLLDPGSGFGLAHSYSSLATRFGNGFSDFYGTHLPFDPRVHTAMGELVLAAIFVFALLVALLAAARKPVGSALALLVGAGWPATLLGPSYGLAMGAAILGGELVLLAGLGSRRLPALALPAAAVVATAAVAVGSATAARHGLVHWQSWNLTHAARGPVGVDFVWNAQYGGLSWPRHPTVVLRVDAAQTPAYLRATVLDDFVGDAWENGVYRTADALEPAAALQPRNETREVVTVEGLADTHLVGGSIPVRFAAGSAPLVEPVHGFATLSDGLPPGFRYTVWSYDPRATAAALQRSAPEYPPALAQQGLFDIGYGTTMPAFGTPDRTAVMLERVTRDPALNPYMPLARLAEDVAGRARTPYDAVLRLENWFVAAGHFRYSNHPLVIAPALVGFVTQTRTGYCQFFAGAMALMLRYLGIPARVAVGFAGGRYDANAHDWLVTDRDAHAWVEVWFKGYGWLPFDPTPAAPGAARRPTRAGAAGRGFGPEAIPFGPLGSGGTKGGSATVADNLTRKNGIAGPHGKGSGTAQVARLGEGSGSRARPALLLLLVLAAAGGGIVLTKTGIRLLRRLRRDPRRVAAACREELAAFLLDQRVEAPRSATLSELGDFLQREFGVDPAPFVAAATAARYGRAEDAAAAVQAARRELRILLDGARRCLTRRERLRGLLSLRSLARPPAAVDASASLSSGMVG
jgi:transglutaminase-like putative cysteine protease